MMTQANKTTDNRVGVRSLSDRNAKLEEIIGSVKASKHQVAA
jgi:hypothetical protein